MAALPYIQLYVADYLADTMHLSTEEHGAYLLLIMNYWQTGKPIPKKRLASVARLSNERWNQVEDTLRELFTEDDNNCWFHGRIEQELEKVLSKSSKASAAGKASAAKRAAKQALEKQKESNERSTQVQPESNHTDTDTDTDIKHTSESYDSDFLDFWKCYPRKDDKKKAAKSWKKLTKKNKQLAYNDIKDRYIDTDKKFIPLPTTYINGERWNDEKSESESDLPYGARAL